MSHTFIAHDCSVGEKSVITSGVRILGNATIGREFIWEQIVLFTKTVPWVI